MVLLVVIIMNTTRLTNLKFKRACSNNVCAKSSKGGFIVNLLSLGIVCYGIGLGYHVVKNGKKSYSDSVVTKDNDNKTIFFDTCDGIYNGAIVGLTWPKLVYDEYYTKE